MNLDTLPPDKIHLLMEETGCDRAQAELAMSLAGFDLEKAIRTIGTLLRDIVVLKGKFVEPSRHLHGLFFLIANTRPENLIRARAVVSHNPALFETPLDVPWYDFEKSLYASRLGEGARQQMSQDLERSLADCLENRRDKFFASLKSSDEAVPVAFMEECLSHVFPGGVLDVRLEPEVIDQDQFRRFPIKGDERFVPNTPSPRAGAGDNLVLHVDPAGVGEEGVPSREVRVGDSIRVLLTDGRDIARYLAKLLGASDDQGPRPFEAPVEECRQEGDRVQIQVRLSTGILGLVELSAEAPVSIIRRTELPWWQRWILQKKPFR